MEESVKVDEKIVKRFLNGTSSNAIYIHYLIPLTENKVLAFGLGKVLSVHISADHSLLYLRMAKILKRREHIIEELNNFKFFVELKDEVFAVFSVPDKYIPEIALMLKGRTTEMQNATKHVICKNSYLSFNTKHRSIYRSHFYLQALYEYSPVREVLAAYTGVKLSAIPTELLAQLEETSTVYIENWMGAN